METPPPHKPVILYFGNDWLAENRTSSHQIVRRLAKVHPVYYIECPGLRAPTGSARDLRKIAIKLLRFLQGPRPVPEGLRVYTVLQIPLHRFALVRRLNRFLLVGTLRWLLWREWIASPILWFLLPHLAPVLGRLGERLRVYYCTDDYAAFPGVNVAAVQAMDEEMTRKADIVFVASATLLEAKRRLNPNTHVSPHGVDFDHFAQAHTARLPVPDDMATLPGPVVGFFGLIEHWIDLELVDYLAAQRPHWSFVLIGRVAVPEADVPRRPNLHYLGRRPYESLPAYAQRFDVAIIPYRRNRQTLHANPLKLREYLATGKPVVSVSTPEIDPFADVVAIAHSPEEFLAHLDTILSRPPSPVDARRRMERVAGSSWDARAAAVLEVVHRCLTAEDDKVTR